MSYATINPYTGRSSAAEARLFASKKQEHADGCHA